MSQQTDTEPAARRTLGPGDAGRSLAQAEFDQAEWTAGYRYELVAGRLSVNPAPNPHHDDVAEWLHERLLDYKRARPDVIDRVSGAARLQTRALGAPTDVQPDLAAYRGYYAARPSAWREVFPVLVAEVVSPSKPEKDLERNRALYLLVEAIAEYWILDPRPDPARTSLIALRRGPDGWTEERVAAGGRYATPLLPGFELDLSTVYPA